MPKKEFPYIVQSSFLYANVLSFSICTSTFTVTLYTLTLTTDLYFFYVVSLYPILDCPIFERLTLVTHKLQTFSVRIFKISLFFHLVLNSISYISS